MRKTTNLLLESKLFLMGRNLFDAEMHLHTREYAADMVLDVEKAEKILLSGASGMLGSAIGAALRQQGASVLRLVRRQAKSSGEIEWNPTANQIDAEGLNGVTGAIHLSGASVAGRRWTAGYKREITESRVATTRLLAETLAQLKQPPRVLITASAVGFYGDRGDEILDEDSLAGVGFLSELCQAWEAAAQPAKDAGIRVVQLRFGMVIGRKGGPMARLLPIFRLGLGGRLGSGRQWISWVSEADVVSAAIFALRRSDLSGPVNMVAPEPATNAEFTREVGRAVHRPALLPAPAFALRLAFGEMADEMLLASERVLPKRLSEAGFVFAHPTLPEALAAALGK